MTWLSWRQFRAQAVVAGLVLGALAVYLVVVAYQIRHSAYVRCESGCEGLAESFEHRFANRLYFLDAGLLVLPALVGAFWGAPLVARELEAGTHRLVWNQSITRQRWLAVKLLVVGAATAVVAGLFSALLTWAASPYDAVAADRFTALLFGTRNVAPVGYAVFAFVLGAVLGLLLRRTLPAMALTVVLVVVAQIVTPTLVRPQLRPPVTASQPMTAEAIGGLRFLGADAAISGVRIPGAMVVSTTKLLGADGRVVDLDRYRACVDRSPESAPACLEALDLHVEVSYHPADRYWTFQWLELGLLLGLSGLLAGVALWGVRRRSL
ncbi:ABC transporter permease subunit [Cryptosporangium aurantiacum]|uniref:ABC-2 family transporter protein n=1 Tax=Cryptosporangium aurantiacum TaxID=134849 RepID=A0A1M7QTN0_9ACTN|nr:ABC transporter permease subunit [Cryptosporangium aurantiacum]SHN35124.1 ABC-2 family transporter protein [Cryptosporangium aurantiacum]